MRCATLLMPVLACLLTQALGNIPPKEDLCGLIVDALEEEKCLDCFTKAGHISQHPQKVRHCVGKHLPPVVAECSVPHPDDRLAGAGRMQHGPSDLHHNHTNANLLPNCISRRMRDMARYLRREKRFTREASAIVNAVVLQKLLVGGGSAMLGIESQNAILAIPEVQAMVNTHCDSCRTDFGEETARYETRQLAMMSTGEEDDEKDDEEDDSEYLLRFDDYDKEDGEYIEVQRGEEPSPLGNNLPFGGTNSLARKILLGRCIVDFLIKNGAGMDLLEILKNDEFFYPIPHWWVEPMLRLYKESEGSN